MESSKGRPHQQGRQQVSAVVDLEVIHLTRLATESDAGRDRDSGTSPLAIFLDQDVAIELITGRHISGKLRRLGVDFLTVERGDRRVVIIRKDTIAAVEEPELWGLRDAGAAS